MSDSPLERMVRAIGDTTVPDDEHELALPQGALAGGEEEARFLLYAGIVDLVAEAAVRNAINEGRDSEAVLSGALADARAAEGPLKFARHDRGSIADQHELTARMRGKHIALTSEWLIPRLQDDIEAYRGRIGALRAAIEEHRT